MSEILFILLTSGAFKYGVIYSIAFVLITFVLPMFHRESVKCNYLKSGGFWLLLFFGLLYSLFDGASLDKMYTYCVTSVLAYAMGWCAIEQGKKNAFKSLLFALTVGFGIYVCLNYSVNIGKGRYALLDFWTGSYRAATGSGALNTFVIATAFYVLILEKRLRMKLLLGVFIVVSILYMFMLGTRTQFVILLLVIFLSTFHYCLEKRLSNSGIKILLTFMLIALVLSFVYTMNIGGIYDYVQDSNLLIRYADTGTLSRSDNNRINVFFTGVKELVLYPLGGRSDQPYRHNMWLDVSRETGVIPFALLFAYTLYTWRNMKRVFRNRQVEIGVRYLVYGAYCAVYMNFFMEPVMEGIVNFFYAFCVVSGMTDRVSSQLKNRGYSSYIKPDYFALH